MERLPLKEEKWRGELEVPWDSPVIGLWETMFDQIWKSFLAK
jgi:hypothetical protein